MKRFLLALAMAGTALLATAEDKAPAPGKTSPDGVSLEATIEAKEKTFKLDLGELNSADFKKMIEDAKEKGTPIPQPQKLDFKLVLKNTGKEAIKVYEKGDSVTIELELKGKGALQATPALAVTADFRLPQAVEIEAGKTIELPIAALAGGFRGIGHYWYWTEAGEYELVATFKTGVNPAPKGAADAGDGFGAVQIASKAIKLKVEAKK